MAVRSLIITPFGFDSTAAEVIAGIELGGKRAIVTGGSSGIGVETADMLVHEVLSRDLRDRRAVARYAGLTGAPDESGARRREKGLAKAGNARVRRGMIQLAWRFLLFQKDSALARWYRARTADARGGTRKAMIVAPARKLLITPWTMLQEAR